MLTSATQVTKTGISVYTDGGLEMPAQESFDSKRTSSFEIYAHMYDFENSFFFSLKNFELTRTIYSLESLHRKDSVLQPERCRSLTEQGVIVKFSGEWTYEAFFPRCCFSRSSGEH